MIYMWRSKFRVNIER